MLDTGYDVSDLLDSASDYASEAIHDFERERWHLLPLHAGAAAELLAKAALAQISPLLLADGGNNLGKTLVQLAGIEIQNHDEIRTVGLSEAVERLRLKYPDLSVKKEHVLLLSKGRNAAVHLGAKSTSNNRILSAFIMTCTALLGRCGRSPAKFWNEYEALAREVTRLNIGESHFKAKVRIAMAEARSADASAAGIRSAHAEAAARSQMRDHQEAAACPVCGCLAIFDGEHEHGRHGWQFIPEKIVCHGCELRLRKADLIALDHEDVKTAFEPRSSTRPESELRGQRGLWR